MISFSPFLFRVKFMVDKTDGKEVKRLLHGALSEDGANEAGRQQHIPNYENN
jgi:hypothetical protein